MLSKHPVYAVRVLGVCSRGAGDTAAVVRSTPRRRLINVSDDLRRKGPGDRCVAVNGGSGGVCVRASLSANRQRARSVVGARSHLVLYGRLVRELARG